jgi:hypothetical protein
MVPHYYVTPTSSSHVTRRLYRPLLTWDSEATTTSRPLPRVTSRDAFIGLFSRGTRKQKRTTACQSPDGPCLPRLFSITLLNRRDPGALRLLASQCHERQMQKRGLFNVTNASAWTATASTRDKKTSEVRPHHLPSCHNMAPAPTRKLYDNSYKSL